MSPALSMEWHDALFCHWRVSPSVLEPHVPDALDVDVVDGDAWLGTVGFRMVDLRARRSPIVRSFPEVNARTYVSHDGTPGTYFFSLDAPDRLVVRLARLEGLPYYLAETRLRERGNAYAVACRRTHDGAPPGRFVATLSPDGQPFRTEPGTLAQDLAERTTIYCERGETLRVGTVHRDRFSLAPATADVSSVDLFPRSIDIGEPDHCWYGAPDGIAVRADPMRPVDR